MNILQTRHGLMMVRQGPDMISNMLMQRGEYEWQVVVLCNALSGKFKDGYILDIGANMGTVTIPLAKLKPQYTFRCFEPQKPIYYQLVGNVALNDLENVEVNMMGVGKERGTIYIDLPDYKTNTNVGAWTMDPLVRKESPEGKAGGKEQQVRIERLDDMHFKERIRLIKVDVEGMELEVFEGGKALLQDHNYPPLVYESWPHYDWYQDKAKTLEALIRSMGYETYAMGLTMVAVHQDNELKVNVKKDADNMALEVLNEF